MSSLSETAVEVALTNLGVHEQGGANRGPEVNAFLAAVGLDPGYPWCAAFVYFCFREATKLMGPPWVNPCPRVASALRMWALSEPVAKDSNPSVGAIYVLKHSPTEGHVGIVTGIADDGSISEVSGNTFDSHGGREGNCVALHVGQPEVTHGGVLQGYLQLDRAAQPPGVG